MVEELRLLFGSLCFKRISLRSKNGAQRSPRPHKSISFRSQSNLILLIPDSWCNFTIWPSHQWDTPEEKKLGLPFLNTSPKRSKESDLTFRYFARPSGLNFRDDSVYETVCLPRAEKLLGLCCPERNTTELIFGADHFGHRSTFLFSSANRWGRSLEQQLSRSILSCSGFCENLFALCENPSDQKSPSFMRHGSNTNKELFR